VVPGFLLYLFRAENWPGATAGFDARHAGQGGLGPSEWNGKSLPRFTRIVDPDVIAKLEAIEARMYPDP
jgi:hypothetical protein